MSELAISPLRCLISQNFSTWVPTLCIASSHLCLGSGLIAEYMLRRDSKHFASPDFSNLTCRPCYATPLAFCRVFCGNWPIFESLLPMMTKTTAVSSVHMEYGLVPFSKHTALQCVSLRVGAHRILGHHSQTFVVLMVPQPR